MSLYRAMALQSNVMRAMCAVEYLMDEKPTNGRRRLYFSLLDLAEHFETVKYS